MILQWASAGSTEQNTAAAIRETAAAVRAELGAAAPDLIVAFVSAHQRERFSDIAALVRREFRSGLLIGCSAGGVIGGRQPGDNALFLGDETLAPGMVDVALSGNVRVDTSRTGLRLRQPVEFDTIVSGD